MKDVFQSGRKKTPAQDSTPGREGQTQAQPQAQTHQLDVTHAKLTNIYSEIDARNYKQALKLIEQSMKKYPQSLILKSLKAIVLNRSGKPSKALLWAKEVQDAEPTDSSILDTLKLTYDALNLHSESTRCWENAVAKVKKPTESLLTGLFFCYVRERRYQDQAILSMRLNREFGKQKYFMWGVMSNLMQFWSGSGKPMHLTLAERLMEKREVFENEDALLVFLEILREREEWGKLLTELRGTRAEKLMRFERERRQMIAETLAKLGKEEEIVKELVFLLENIDGDEWSAYLGIFEAFKRKGKEPQGPQGPQEQKELKAEDQLEDIIARHQAANSKLRAPFLAELSYWELFQEGNDGREDKLVELLLSFYDKFGMKPSCALDIERYLKLLSRESKTKILGKFEEKTKSKQGGGVLGIQFMVTFRQICQCLFEDCYAIQSIDSEGPGPGIDEKRLLTTVRENIQICQSESHKSPSGDSPDGADTCLEQEALLMDSALLLGRLFDVNEEWTTLALALLALAIEKTKGKSFRAIYMAIMVYNRVGAVNSSLELYHELDVRQIQLLSQSHLVIDSLLSCFALDEAEEVLQDVQEFRSRNMIESRDFDVFVYENSTYSKVLEFRRLAQKIAASQTANSASAEAVNMMLISKSSFTSSYHVMLDHLMMMGDLNRESSYSKLEDLQDTNDTSVLYPWERHNFLFHPDTKRSTSTCIDMSTGRDCQLSLLKLRQLLNRMLFSILQGGSPEVGDPSKLREELKEAFMEYKQREDSQEENIRAYRAIIKMMEGAQEALRSDGAVISFEALEKDIDEMIAGCKQFAIDSEAIDGGNTARIPSLHVSFSSAYLMLSFTSAFTILFEMIADRLNLKPKSKGKSSVSPDAKTQLKSVQKKVLELLREMEVVFGQVKRDLEEKEKEGEVQGVPFLNFFKEDESLKEPKEPKETKEPKGEGVEDSKDPEVEKSTNYYYNEIERKYKDVMKQISGSHLASLVTLEKIITGQKTNLREVKTV